MCNSYQRQDQGGLKAPIIWRGRTLMHLRYSATLKPSGKSELYILADWSKLLSLDGYVPTPLLNNPSPCCRAVVSITRSAAALTSVGEI